MVRRTKKTMRRIKNPLEKELIGIANDLHRLNARVMKLATKVGDKEADSTALHNMTKWQQQEEGHGKD